MHRAWIAFTVLTLVGCANSGSTPVAGAKSAERPTVEVESKRLTGGPRLTGEWVTQVEMPKPKDPNDPAETFVDGMGKAMGGVMGMLTQLEFPTEDRFRFAMMGVAVEGKVERTGNQIRLVPERFAGIEPEELKNADPKDREPMVGVVAADGETITLDGEKPDTPKLVFRRKPHSERKDTVASEERDYVGRYHGTPDKETLKGAKDAAERSILENVRLELRKDNTFRLTLVFDIEGKWRRDEQSILLNPTGVAGIIGDASSGGKPVKLEVRGDRLAMTATEGTGEIVFARE